jgi:hypothetical protein
VQSQDQSLAVKKRFRHDTTPEVPKAVRFMRIAMPTKNSESSDM